MSYPCIKCGQSVDAPNQVCKRCSSEQTSQKIMIGAAVSAFLVIIVIIALILLTSSSTSESTKVTTPVPTKIATPISTPTTSTTPVINSTIKPDVLANYSATVQPLMSDVRAEMTATVLDIKDFLKVVNTTKDSKDARSIIDNFREQMKRHNDKLFALSRSLRSIAPPTQLEAQHQKLNLGINKYSGAVQGYIQGLAAYNFQQIRASQTQLEQADKELVSVMQEFQQFFATTNK